MKQRYVYYWYTHLVPCILTLQDGIHDMMLNHDYASFKSIQEAFNYNPNFNNCVFFPDYFVDAETHEHIDISERTFSMIEDSDCECG